MPLLIVDLDKWFPIYKLITKSILNDQLRIVGERACENQTDEYNGSGRQQKTNLFP